MNISRALLAALVVLAATGCAHRYPLASTESRQALSGVPLAFGDKAAPAPPQSTDVRWEFSDGATEHGAAVSHAFPFAGRYTATEIVTDEQGERRAQVAVEVARRGPLLAVPPEADSALVLDRFFNRFPTWRTVLAKAMPAGQLDDALDRMQQSLGVDLRSPEQLRAAGIDPDEGLAWISFPEERYGRYLAIGTYDDTMSGVALRAALTRAGASFSEGLEGFTRAHLPDAQDDLFFKHERGYLVIRVPGDHPEAPLGLAHFSRAPETGVADLPAVRVLRARLEGGDVLVYQGEAAFHPEGRTTGISAHMHALLATFLLAPDEVTGEALVAVDPEGQKSIAGFFAAQAVPALPDHAPAGAAFYASFSGDAQALFELLTGSSSGHRSRIEDELAREGVDLRQLLGLLGQGGAVAGYFDQAEYYRALIETRVPLPRGEVLAEGAIKDGAAVQQMLEQLASASHQPPSTRHLGDGTRMELTLGGHPAGAYVTRSALLLSFGLKHLDDAIAPGATPRLASQLKTALPPEALQPARLVLYVDVAGVVDRLTPDAPIPGTRPDDLLRAELFTRVAAAPFAPVRDALCIVTPAPEGVHASFRLRLR